MAATIVTTAFPLKKGSPPAFGTLYSGRALTFDGVADYISFSDTGFPSGSSARTVLGWVYFDTTSVDALKQWQANWTLLALSREEIGCKSP